MPVHNHLLNLGCNLNRILILDSLFQNPMKHGEIKESEFIVGCCGCFGEIEIVVCVFDVDADFLDPAEEFDVPCEPLGEDMTAKRP